MPNWCYNTVTFSHEDPAMIERLAKAADNDKVLQEFIPCPQDLLETTAGRLSGDAQIELEKKEKSNLDKYGYICWYDWCVANWGTKWDFGFSDAHTFDDGKSISASFDTAWSPPIEAYQKLQELGFVIHALYYEPGVGFAGEYDNGEDYVIEYDFQDVNWRDGLSDDLVNLMEPEYESYQMWQQENEDEEDEAQEA